MDSDENSRLLSASNYQVNIVFKDDSREEDEDETFLGKRSRVSKRLRNVIIAVLNVITNVIMNVSLPVYAGTMDEVGGGAFVLLMLTSAIVSVLFALMTLFVKHTKIDPSASLRPKSSWKVLFAMGLFTTLNGILIVNASPPNRTPPYLQGILQATVIPYTVVCRLLLLRKGISTVRALCTLVVLVGLFITTEPQIFGIDSSDTDNGPAPSTAQRILWPFCFAIGFLPIGLSNVFCEKELKKDEGESLGFITWTNIFQFVTMIFFFWTDLVPGFGMSDSASQFFDKFHKGLSCNFNAASSCRGLAGKAWLFYFGYCFGNLFQFMLIQYAEGSVYAVIVQSMITPIATIFWTFFNFDQTTNVFQWKPTVNTTTGFTLGGLAVIVPGVFLYNYFSRKESAETSQT